MEVNDLFRCLKEQHQALQIYLDIILAHQKAIISADAAALDATIRSESECLFRVGNCETRRQEILSGLSAKYLLENKSNKLSDFIKEINKKKLFDTRNLAKMQNSMKNLITEIIKVNSQNKLLIEQARNFIKETIAAFMSMNKNSLVDRKY